MAHRWTPVLLAAIAEEYGEPEQPGEHCEAAAEDVLNYLEEAQDYKDEDIDQHDKQTMYDLYLFARWQQGRYAHGHDH